MRERYKEGGKRMPTPEHAWASVHITGVVDVHTVVIIEIRDCTTLLCSLREGNSKRKEKRRRSTG